jgi:putative addiction module CopG family antidote
MFISLSKESEEFIQSLIKEGIYKNASEVLEAAVLLHQQINDKIQKGLDDSRHRRVIDGRKSYEKIKAAIRHSCESRNPGKY